MRITRLHEVQLFNQREERGAKCLDYRDGIFKLLRSPGFDSNCSLAGRYENPIPTLCLAPWKFQRSTVLEFCNNSRFRRWRGSHMKMFNSVAYNKNTSVLKIPGKPIHPACWDWACSSDWAPRKARQQSCCALSGTGCAWRSGWPVTGQQVK